jgi:hypothetical protein
MPRNITVTFSDGSQHIYQNAPDNVTPEAVKTRAESEFKKTVTALDGGRRPETRTAAESLGIGVRNIATGLGGMADIVAAPVNTLANVVAGYQRYSPTPYRDVAERAATAIGLPERGTSGTDLLAQQIIEGATGAALTAGTGIATQGARGLTGAVGKALAAQPVTGVVSGATASGTAEAARQSGAGTGGQIVAGLAGGLSPVAVSGLAGMARRGLAGIRAPAAAVPETAPIAAAPEIPPMGAAPEVPPSVIEPGKAEEIGTIVRKASMGGIGSTKAKEELASLIKINPAAKETADRLGIELPVDVLSDDAIIKEVTGLTRSIQGSEAKSAWLNTVQLAAQRADEVISTLDATPDVAMASANILDNLNGTRSSLEKGAVALRREVDDAIAKTAPISLPKTRELLNQTIEDLGGNRKALTAQENRLLTMIDEADTNPLTYGRLMREKTLIGKALERQESPYGNMDHATLSRIYASMADDQLSNIERIGGQELRDKMRGSNTLFKQKYALEKRIINAFGKEADGSVASLMRNAITAGSKGNIAPLNKLLKVVPKDLQRETIATALMAQTRQITSDMATDTAGTRFGFTQYAKLYRQLRDNAPVYNQIVKILGPESHDLLNGLYVVSKRISDAQANVLTTGKANQGLVGAMKAEGLIKSVVDTTAGKVISTGVAAAGGGPIAAAFVTGIQSAISTGGKDVMQEAGKLMSSREFQDLAIKAASGDDVSPVMVKKLVMSERFKKFATAAKLPANAAEREAWVTSALQTGIQAAQPAPVQGPTFEFDNPEMQAAYEASLTQEPPQ